MMPFMIGWFADWESVSLNRGTPGGKHSGALQRTDP